MGGIKWLRRLLTKRRKQEKPTQEEIIRRLAKYDDLRAEVQTKDGAKLFSGRLLITFSGSMRIIQTKGKKQLLPRYDVYLTRFYSDERKIAIKLSAHIEYLYSNIWKLENVQLVDDQNGRNSYRVHLYEDGRIIKELYTRDCKVHNISSTGAYIVSDALLAVGGRFRLQVKRLTRTLDRPIHCEVQRITALKNGMFGYACLFRDMEKETDEALTRWIFERQREYDTQ